MADDRRDAPSTDRPAKLKPKTGRDANGTHPCMTKWRVLSPSVQVMVDPASRARGIIRDTCADGAYRFHWSVLPSEESLPIAAGRTGGLARARSIADEALHAYAHDWLSSLGDETEAVVSNP
jgi:hypothetical protein